MSTGHARVRALPPKPILNRGEIYERNVASAARMTLCFALGLGSLMGCPMRAEEIEELMAQTSQPKIAHVLPVEDEDGEEK